jgi:hypothetical protein
VATRAGFAGCDGGQLAGQVEQQQGQAAETFGWVVLRNRSTQACQISDFSGAQLRLADGRLLRLEMFADLSSLCEPPFRVCRAASLVALQPNERAFVGFSYNGNPSLVVQGPCERGVRLEIRPRGGSSFVSVSGVFTPCGPPYGLALSAVYAGSPLALEKPFAPQPRTWVAVGDVDGDGKPDTATLLYLGGHGPGNWQLVADLSRLGRQSVRFNGMPVVTGERGIVSIVGHADADGSGRSSIFVLDSWGASTQFWAVFKLVGPTLVQATSDGSALALAVGGSVSHEGGFQCLGRQFVTTGASGVPGATTLAYERDILTWHGSVLQLQARQRGHAPMSTMGSFGKVACGSLPDYAP